MNHTLKLALILYLVLLAFTATGSLLYRRCDPRFVSLGIILGIIAISYSIPQGLRWFAKSRTYEGNARGRILALARKQNIKFSDVEVVPSESLGAWTFGFGMNRVFAISRGMAEKFSPEEIEAVAAHEIGHLVHRDVHFYTGIAIIVALLGGLLTNIPGILLSPLFLVLPLAAISRRREIEADRYAALAIGNPAPLVSGFRKAMPILEAEGINMTTYAWWEKILALHPSFTERIRKIRR